MIIHPSGTILVTKVDENNNFIEDSLDYFDLEDSLSSNLVSITGYQTISGQKNFLQPVLLPSIPTLSGEASNKYYVDQQIGGVTLSTEWRFDSNTANSDPGSGNFRFSNISQISSQFLYLDNETHLGLDVSNLIAKLVAGDFIYLQQKDAPDASYLFQIESPSIDSGGYWRIPLLSGTAGGVDISNNKLCVIILQTTGVRDASDIYVTLTGTQNINGQKTFTQSPIVPDPTLSGHAVDKYYADLVASNAVTSGNSALLSASGTLQSAIDLKAAITYVNSQDAAAVASGLASLTTASGILHSYTDTQAASAVASGNSALLAASGVLQTSINQTGENAVTSGNTALIAASGVLKAYTDTVGFNAVTSGNTALLAASGVLAAYTNTKVADAVTSGNVALIAASGVLAAYTDTKAAAAVTSGFNSLVAYSGVAEAAFVNVSGDTMTGALTLSGVPTLSGHASNKYYTDVQDAAVLASGTRVNHVYVKTFSDFPTPISGVITLSGNTDYELNGIINISSNYLLLNNNTHIYGVNTHTDGIIYSGSVAAIQASGISCDLDTFSFSAPNSGGKFISYSGTTSQNLRIEDIYLGSYAGNSAYEIGNIYGAGHAEIIGCDFNNVSSGIRISGTIDRFLIEDCEFRNPQTTTFRAIDVISGININALSILDNHFKLPSGTQIDINAASNLVVSGGMILVGNYFTGSGIVFSGGFDATTNGYISGKANIGLANTKNLGYLTISGNATATLTSNTANYFVVSGTNNTSIGERFTVTNNKLLYAGKLGTIQTEFYVTGSLSSPNANQNLRFTVHKFTNSLSSSAIVVEQSVRTTASNTFTTFSLNGIVSLSENDYLEVRVRNTSGTNDVLVDYMQFKVVQY